jgi:hypothetical protein
MNYIPHPLIDFNNFHNVKEIKMIHTPKNKHERKVKHGFI